MPEMNWRTLRSTAAARCSLASSVHWTKCVKLRPNVPPSATHPLIRSSLATVWRNRGDRARPGWPAGASRPSCRTSVSRARPALERQAERSASSLGEASSGSILSLKLRVRCSTCAAGDTTFHRWPLLRFSLESSSPTVRPIFGPLNSGGPPKFGTPTFQDRF